MPEPEIDHAKQAIREKVWARLAREGAAPPDVYGYIPDFVGAEQAAARLAELDAWRQAHVIKANPDRAQLPVRIRALQEGKLLYMAVPRLATLSVAVNQQGVRVGKGAGYSDIEVALLTEAELIGPETTIVTTVHQLQVIDDELPDTEHDFGVDVIVTPIATIMCKPTRRLTEVIPDHLDSSMAKNIPSLDGHFPPTP